MKEKRVAICYSTSDIPTIKIDLLAEALRSLGIEVVPRLYWGKGIAGETFTDNARDIAATAKDLAAVGVQRLVEGLNDILSAEQNRQNSKDGAPETLTPKADDFDAYIYCSSSGLSHITPTNAQTLRIGLIATPALACEWQNTDFDAMCVAHPTMMPYLASEGFEQAQLFDGAYVIDDAWHHQASKEELKQQLGVDGKKGPTILIMADGMPSRELQTIFIQLGLITQPIQPIFYHGDVEETASRLRSLAKRSGIAARMLGKLDRLGDYVGVADLVVVKNTHRLFAEVLSLGQPLLCLEDEASNALSDFVVRQKAGIHIPRVVELARAINRLLADVERFVEMTEAATQLAGWASTQRCADTLKRILEADTSLLELSHRLHEVVDMRRGGGFEIIGESKAHERRKNNEKASHVTPFVEPLKTRVRTDEVVSAVLKPTVEPKTFDEIHQEYTQLVLLDRAIDRELASITQKVRDYELYLSNGDGDENRKDEAAEALEKSRRLEMSLYEKRENIKQQKLRLKALSARYEKVSSDPFDDDIFDVAHQTASSIEQEIEQLKRQNALNELKDRMK